VPVDEVVDRHVVGGVVQRHVRRAGPVDEVTLEPATG
jgi:hypothetical protein